MRRLAVVAVSVALASCAVAKRLRFEAPDVQLAEVRVTGIGLSGGSLELDLDVFNPNAYELRSTRIAATVDLEGTHFGDAMLERAVALPAESHSTVEIPMRFTWEGVGAGARALLATGSVRYTLGGRLIVDTPVGAQGVSLRRSGTATMRDLTR